VPDVRGRAQPPIPGGFWDIIERHGVTIFYTAPTAIRAFMKWGEQWPMKHDLSCLRLLGTVGEPINPEAWMWYQRAGHRRRRCPIVDTWWQTETGRDDDDADARRHPTKPGSCTVPFFGVTPKVLQEDGTEARPTKAGSWSSSAPWPSMMRTIWGDDQRFKDTYFTRFPGKASTSPATARAATSTATSG
jgi:acetyl-CoA synthetase